MKIQHAIWSALYLAALACAPGCQTYLYNEYDPQTGAKVRDGAAFGVVTKPAFDLDYATPEGKKLRLKYARENDIEGLGAAIGAGVRSAVGVPAK